MQEVWKDIKGYEGLYQVSNKGRVRSLDRKDWMHVSNCYRKLKGKILKPGHNTWGYQQVQLSDALGGKKGKRVSVHRLVACAFIPNPNEYPCVNHKDCNKDNNSVDNLEWCTHEYNNNYGDHNKKVSESLKGKRRSNLHKPILGISKDKKSYLYFACTHDAQTLAGIDCGSIVNNLKGRRKSAGGYAWEYVG